VAGYEGLSRVRRDRSVQTQIADLAALIDEEGEVHRLRTVRDGIRFMRERMELIP
jgi:hypothetical protein